ncbi:thiamine phosphate synthase [Sulfurospirillum sp. 1612]|uniref:thiamine phosphate synthase n=1 Tax=Sulfurospirillum sp. 1612 TaxID=3094835 RepID=UPI002F92BA65
MPKRLKGLYAITDERLTPENTIIDQCHEALDCGIKILQYRDKTHKDEEIEQTCATLQALCQRYEAAFIINDRPYLAQKINADGLHVGKDDMSLSKTRQIFTDGMIGVSCYGSLEMAQEAQKMGATYVAFGAFFPTPTKPDAGVFPMEVLSQAKAHLSLPVCAIGGINIQTIQSINHHQPDMLCCVSAIFAGNIKDNIQQLNQKIQRGF